MRLINLNLEGDGRVPEGAIYIGRAHAGRRLAASPFANPFPLQNRSDDEERRVILDRYRDWLWEEIKANRITVTDLQRLDGHDLACFCAPQLCHGMVVQKAVEWARDKTPGSCWRDHPNPLVAPRVRTLSDWLSVGPKR